MGDAVLILPDDSANTGQKLDEASLTVGANTVLRQRIVIADPTGAAGLAAVDATDGLSVNLMAAGGTAIVAEPKGTQAANFLPVQAAKDSGRTYVTLHAENLSGTTTEALTSFTVNKGGVETTGQTQYTVTAGKTLRLQSLSIYIKDTTTTANNTLVRGRVAGTVAAGSPIIAALFASAPAAVASAVGCANVDWADGIEIAGGQQIGITHLDNVTTASIWGFCLVGYEY